MSGFGENPYVGAQPLTARNPLFGRDREVRDLYFLLSKERIVLMYSPSGAGKSSLLEGCGGLLDQMYERFQVWPVTRVNTQAGVPARNPYVLSALLGFERAVAPEHMRSENQLAGLTLREGVLGRWRNPEEPKIVFLVFDQFEEIIRLNPTDVEGQREFFRQLGELLSEPTVWALLVMREDYLAAIDPYCRQVPTHLRNRYRLDLLSREAATDAIAKTAKTAGRYWDDDAVGSLVNDLALVKVQPLNAEPYVVPGNYVEPLHLQVVCRDLWDKLAPDDESFGMDDLGRIGNVDMALAAYYRRSVREISNGDLGVERMVRNWFAKELITPGHVRGQVLRGKSESGGLANQYIEALVAKHIVRAEKRSGATWYELSHDRLIPAVEGCNLIWFEKNLSDLERRVELWMAQAKTADLLVTGGVLRAFNKWAKQNASRLHENERAFLYQSKRENGKVWLRRGLVSAVVIAMFFSVVLSLEADSQRDQANFNAAVNYSGRADEAVSRGKWEEAWLYTLASLNADWSSSNSLPESFGRLLRFEIYPAPEWREVAALALGKVKRIGASDRILYVAAGSGQFQHDEAILQQNTASGFNVYHTSPDPDVARLPGLFTYNFEGQTTAWKEFNGELYCAVVGGKRYFAGGTQILEDAVLTDPPNGRALTTGGSPVIAMRNTMFGLGVLTKDGGLRFANPDSMVWREKKLQRQVEPAALAGFDAVGDEVAAFYDTTAEAQSRIEIFHAGPDQTIRTGKVHHAEGRESYRAVAIISGDPLIVAYGTSGGEVGLIDFSTHEDPRIIARTVLHRTAVVQLTALGKAEQPDHQLLSVSDDGEVRRIDMTMTLLGEERNYTIWRLAKAPRDEVRALFTRLQENSLLRLPFKWYPPRFELQNWPALLVARSDLFGQDYLYQYRRFEESVLTREADGGWNWKNSNGLAMLREKRRDNSSLVLEQGALEIRVPLQAGGWVTVKGLEFARVVEAAADRVKLASGYFLAMDTDRWRIGSGGEIRPSVYSLQIRLADGEPILRSESSEAAFVLPRGDGPLLFRAEAMTFFPLGNIKVTQVHYIADPWNSPAAPHSIQYRQVSINDGVNTVRVPGGQAVVFRARWEIVEGADKSKQQNFLLGMATPVGGIVSQCVASIGGGRPAGQRKSGDAYIAFKAPAQPGWYFLTHVTQEGDKCEAAPSLFATGPDNAVAAILVEEPSNGAR